MIMQNLQDEQEELASLHLHRVEWLLCMRVVNVLVRVAARGQPGRLRRANAPPLVEPATHLWPVLQATAHRL